MASRSAAPTPRAAQRPRRGRMVRRAVDVALALAFSLVMATALVEDFAHEWLGLVLCALVVAHQALNRSWWRALARGRWAARRALSTAVDLGLAAAVLALLVSALVVSVHAFSWLPVIPGALWARPAHLLGSYWGYLLAGLHVGFHVQPALARALRSGGAARVAAGAACVLVLGAGAWSFAALDVGTYLTYASPFVFVDFDAPLVLRWAQWLAVGALYALAGAAAWALLGRGGRASGSERGPSHDG